MICPLVSTVEEALQDPAAVDLIPADGRAGIAALARRLPDVMHGFGFELRLRTPGAAVDFYTSIAARGGGREAWAGSAPAHAPPWQRVAALARQWAEPASLLHSRVEMVFLEFDAPFTVGQPPSVFARLDSAIGDGGAQWAHAAGAVDELALALMGQRASAATRAHLAAVFGALPPGGRIVDVAAMLPRGAVTVRLFITMPRAGLPDYLTALGWTDSGARRDLAGVLWRAMGERLRSCGLGDADQLATLTRWPGAGPARAIDHVATRARWPSQLVRLISHVKVVLEPSRPVEAKAYLWATRRFAQLGA